MPLINIKRVIPDMLLEESIKNFTGQVLLGRGTNLTSMNIKKSQSLGNNRNSCFRQLFKTGAFVKENPH